MGSFGFKRRHGLSFYGMGYASNTGNKSRGVFFDFLVLHKSEILMFLPFFVMDLSLRIMGHKIEFYPAYYLQPNLFTIIWVGLFIVVTKYLKGIFGKIFYWFIFIISFIMFLTNAIYYPLTSFYFNFSLLELASEGSSYIGDTIKHTPVYVYIIALIVVVLAVAATINMKKSEKFQGRKLLISFIVFICLHLLIPVTMGSGNKNLRWNSFKKARNVYNEFSDSNKSMKVSGLYEYTVRNFYITFLKPKEKISDSDKKFLKNIYEAKDDKKPNDYTGLFKGKNVIFLQLEGMDEWLLTKKNTPNLYKLKNESVDFTNHFSIYTGGGSTFNSEFAVNTGFTTPISYNENVYTFNKNTFNNTMAKLFKNQGYAVNAFHMNSSEFYSRGINYRSWGYDNYYGLKDILDSKDKEDLSYELDRKLIENKTFYNKMFKQNDKFVDYIISYTPHTPFTTEKEVGKLVAEMKYGKGKVPKLSEEQVADLMVGETDYMVGLLIQALKDNNLYDNTVIVAYADHYLYTINDKSVLDKYKETDNNLINRTPFFIWSSDVKSQKIDKANMQMNILPTVLNLFGIDYNSNYYIGKDILSDDYEPLAFFSDSSWYDGNAYVSDAKVTNGAKISEDEVEKKSKTVEELIKKNDLTLKYDFLKDYK
jgi:lipoteichoic acid synthase